MSKFTPEAYAESARKYGITPGPWQQWLDHPDVFAGGIVNNTPFSIKGGERIAEFAFADDSPSGEERATKNAEVCAQLPNLLIERDALKAENERLRKALETLRNLHTDAVFVCGVDDEQRAHEALMSADAALNGGAA